MDTVWVTFGENWATYYSKIGSHWLSGSVYNREMEYIEIAS